MMHLTSKRTSIQISTTSPTIMGIINITPDSFYDGGHYFNNRTSLHEAIDQFNQLGVHMIDVGAESSRPGATPLTADEEIKRLEPVLSTIIESSKAIICIDTYKPKTAQFALELGVDYINDISGGENTDLIELVSKYNAGIILMHKQGEPKSMQHRPSYENVVEDVYHYLKNQVKLSKSCGIESIIIDPGIGFGKTLDHNINLLKHIDRFKSIGCPILIGTSNKSFINDIYPAEVEERLPGSIASVLATYQKGAHIFRVHNVKETIQALKVFEAIQ